MSIRFPFVTGCLVLISLVTGMAGASALVRVSVRRVKVAMASGCPATHPWGLAATRLTAAANARASPV
jgi:hypothetical protein